MGEGNQTQRLLLRPAVERMLEVAPGDLVLDAACGNGVFSRWLAGMGARVVAFDFSAELIARARARTTDHADRIAYHIADATSEKQIVALADGRRFDAALCTQALQDIADTHPLMRALTRLLKPHGRFVITVPHPAFNFSGAARGIEEREDADGNFVVTRYVQVVNYMSAPPAKAPAMAGDPSPHYEFNRPLSVLLAPAFAAGFVLDALEEPAFGDDATPGRPLGWSNFRTIPPVLVARLRIAAP
jgi:SAM-dependent methyltransferase